MAQQSPRIRNIQAKNRDNGDVVDLRITEEPREIFSYGFVGKRYSMTADAVWDVFERNEYGFTFFDVRVFGFFCKNQSHRDHGRVIIESQRWLAEQLETKQANISISLKKLRKAKMLYQETRTVWYINPQLVYCGNGRTHGAALSAMPDGAHIYVQPDDKRAA
ncbi:replication/maintenance protein RepL [Streptomyces subrutilus]|uniref:Plasmid replication protein RepL domain-containing protein n=1 Tax=Streptomyces subrutilus TaxID=36818 RepID=A0A1E5PXC5_9ACTN|nr:replication/maintenance protein RepL [Streptomyces subrutilus]OEJ34166.1 hypothetical protein BGK67_25050 [Streptomyces subrutilus]